MINSLLTRLFSCIFVIVGTLSSAIAQQTTQTVEMADTMRAEGKIYVVVATLVVIFVGIVGYMVMIDRKISKLEKE